MKKKEFIEKLKSLLYGLPANEVKDILADYEEHFMAGMENGKSEEEIARALGNIEDIAQQFREELRDTQPKTGLDLFLEKVFKLFAVSKRNKLILIATIIGLIFAAMFIIQVIFSMLPVILIAAAILLFIAYIKRNKNEAVEITESKEAALTDVNKIVIKTILSHVNVSYHDDKNDKVYINFNGSSAVMSKPYLMVNQAGSILRIQIKNRFDISSIFNFYRQKLKLEIKLPRTFQDNLQIETISGSIDATELKSCNFNANTISGKIKTEKIAAGQILLKSTSGKCNVLNCRGAVNVKTISSSLTYISNHLDDAICFKSTSGKAKLIIPENSDFKIEYKTLSGRFKSELPLNTNSFSGNKSFEGIIGSGKIAIEVKTVSGGCKILANKATGIVEK